LICAAVAVLSGVALGASEARAAVLSLGPRGVQALVSEQLFNRKGRWYLIDDGACYTYLESPRTHLDAGRLVLNAHLSSRLGQRMGDACAGADFASNVALSGRLRAADRQLILDDIRIERVDDESTRSALALALQLAPQTLPREARIDVLELVRKQVVAVAGLPVRLEQFHVVNLTTRPDGIVVQFDLSLSTP
jgi:hypothetical protein